MIISENSKPSLDEFKSLMKATDESLNRDALVRPEYYCGRNGVQLEKDVYDVLCERAVNTPFEKTITLVSGSSFPDIVAGRYYGVEVKSTNKNQWKSIGSSILESTRREDVERIFLTFGKLADPIAFISRPYEECLSGISVTHYPRYQIDMMLEKGQTIFDELKIPYDKLRKMENPVVPVSKYYRSKLKKGESLWWATEYSDEVVSPPIMRTWSSLKKDEKEYFVAVGFILFPEIFSDEKSNHHKYDGFTKWLVFTHSIIHPNVRDSFTARGRESIYLGEEEYPNAKRVYVEAVKHLGAISNIIYKIDETELCRYWGVEYIYNNRLEQWLEKIEKYVTVDVDKDLFAFFYRIVKSK